MTLTYLGAPMGWSLDTPNPSAYRSLHHSHSRSAHKTILDHPHSNPLATTRFRCPLIVRKVANLISL